MNRTYEVQGKFESFGGTSGGEGHVLFLSHCFSWYSYVCRLERFWKSGLSYACTWPDETNFLIILEKGWLTG